MTTYEDLRTALIDTTNKDTSNLLDSISKITPEDRFPILSQPGKDGWNYFMLAMRYQSNPEVLHQCLELLKGLSLEQRSEILTQTTKDGWNYFMLVMRHQSNPEVLHQCLELIEGLSAQEKMKILTQTTKDDRNYFMLGIKDGWNYFMLAMRYQSNPEVLHQCLELLDGLSLEQRLEILTQTTKDGWNYFMLAMRHQSNPEVLHQCLELLEGLSAEEMMTILAQTTPNGWNYLMLAMNHQKDPNLLSQCLGLLEGFTEEQKSKILTQIGELKSKNKGYNFLTLAIEYQTDSEVLSKCLKCFNELENKEKSKILTQIVKLESVYRFDLLDVLFNLLADLKGEVELQEYRADLLDKIYNEMEKDGKLPQFYYKLAKSSNLVEFFKKIYCDPFWSNGDQHFILAMKALIASKTMPNDLPEDFFPVLIGFAEQTNHDDLAKHLTVKSYFPIIRCDDLDKSTIESIIANQQDYQKIYKIVTMDYSDQDIIDSKIQYYINELATLATKCTNVKDLFSGLDNTCPLIKKIADYYTNISDSPQFDLDLDSSLTKVGLLIDLCETMGWKTDKLTFEKIKENLESDRPSSNPELGL